MPRNPENIRPMRDLVVVRRTKSQSHHAIDPTSKTGEGQVRFAYEESTQTDNGLVLATVASDVTRAVVVAAGKDSSLKPGDIVGVPGREQDRPVMRDVDENSEPWEMWHAHQLHYVADFVEVEA